MFRALAAVLFICLLCVPAQSQTAVTQTVSGCTCTLFNTTVPNRTVSGPDNSVELGAKWFADTNGYVIALRFYKMSNETGTHTGSLWDANGNLLARVTFANETPSGWQQQVLPSPIATIAGTTYVASYHTPNGFEARDGNFFSAAFTAGPMHIPVTGGVYAYGTASNFPRVATQANYYADVVFDAHFVTLNWQPSTTPPPVFYNVFRSQTSGGYTLSLPIASMVAGTTYNDTSVVSGQTYFWEVTAVQQSAPSNEVTTSVP
jgi:hypothetical protein